MISLRFGAEATVSYLFAIADGLAVQALSDPDRDQTEVLEAGTGDRPAALRGRLNGAAAGAASGCVTARLRVARRPAPR